MAPARTPAPTPTPSGTPSGPAVPADSATGSADGSAPGRVLGSMSGRVADPGPTASPVRAAAPVPTAMPRTASALASFPTASPTSVPVTTAASIPVFAAPARPPSPSLSPSPSPPPPPGRTRHGFALGLVAASVVLGGTAVAPASAASSATPVSSPDSTTADQQPACGDPAAKDFPISTRIHGGPDTYASGGGYGTWFLDLTNTTTESCRAIHPVLVLTDEDRKLTSDQIQLKFSEQARPGTEHRVIWETTDRDEHIGVFGGVGGDSFDGFTVPAGRTITIQVRMAFTSDTSPGRITANAAVVQRQRVVGGTAGKAGKDDGAWVGESEDYPFTVVDDSDGGETAETGEASETGETTETGETAGAGEVGGTGNTPREDLPDGTRPSTDTTDTTDTTGTTDTTDGTRRPAEPGRTPAESGRPELAATGAGIIAAPGLTVTGLLIGGGAMVVRARRLRRAHP
ncbi:hypothetical protein ACFV8T_03490 [Streptomyces sp. NPDC059832]|uniref:hypothetical protein n=1 Tax=Streptomyces sp. NPDC059832 TaxID=3346966 RepID=UPI0036484714